MEQFDADDLINRLMGNEDLAKRVAGAFLDTMPQMLTASQMESTALMLRRPGSQPTPSKEWPLMCTDEVRDLASKVEDLGASGSLASAAEVLPELAATFQSLKPVIQRFCDS